MSLQKRQSKAGLYSVIYAALLSLSLVWGYQLETADHLILTDIRAYAVFALLTVVIALIVRKILLFVIRDSGRARADRVSDSRGYTGNEFVKVYLMMTLCNFVVLLGVYPGFFVYDAQTEVTEVLTRSFNTHHPLLHVLLLGGSLAFFNKVMGSYNAGIFA